MQIPKLIAFDVDGTLIDHDGHISESTHRVLTQIRTMDIRLVLATGRPKAVAAHTLEQVGGADWMVCSNGAVLFDVASGGVLRDQVLPAEIIEPVVAGLRRQAPGIGFALELPNRMLDEPGFIDRVPEANSMPPVDDVLASLCELQEPVRRIIAFHEDYDGRLDELAALVAGFVDDRTQVQFGGLPIVDVSVRGVHKAVALHALVDHLGIAASDVIAFGDGGNDIEMLQWAGTGVAMGNARDVVKGAANVVTTSIDDGGVAAFLDPILGGS